MKPDEPVAQDDEQPVAYDTLGQPLYTHPAVVTRQEAMVASQAVHMSTPVEVTQSFISDATKVKHDRSRQLYPMLNLSEGEYVISCVQRHMIGLVLTLGIGLFLVTLAITALFNYDLVVKALHLTGSAANISIMTLPILVFILFICLLTYVAYFVYTSNRFFLTNESIVEQVQMNLFARVQKTIDLGSIEDISFTQSNIIQSLFDYGSIRMGTIGDERSYNYTFVAHPKDQVDILNAAVEAFKSGRPITTK
jgi:uncharacterized membrane protein YdbT with pleckstrin-like domain